MSWKQGGRGYHHGNLREALMRAALDLIAEKGPSGFTVAEAARSAGVSPAAPYRHFRDRDELMIDVAQQGFELFAETLETAWNRGKPDVRVAFERLGRAYLGFARSEPAYFATMFEAGLSHGASPGLREAADRAYGVLREASEALVAELPATRRPPASMVSYHIWAMSHGIASLFARNDEGRRKLPMAPEELLEAGMLIYLDGLTPKAD
ncbi:TetR/AcrR family transcriptional regulator [Breoghania sp.]|uniref:TetR/AcrR family transcriptional regulator n=1 Tax=Breoghania sp. TaxID=2065378 RepID=UPI0029CA40E9|nr:TetR/AcrR family transcriptional regulator [Breoghania sp.]